MATICSQLKFRPEEKENYMQKISPYNKQLYDAIFGFAIGDALGVPYEFQERGSFLCTDLTGYGCHHQPARHLVGRYFHDLGDLEKSQR